MSRASGTAAAIQFSAAAAPSFIGGGSANRKESVAEVQELLTKSSAMPTQAEIEVMAFKMPGETGPSLPKTGMFDWEEFFKKGHKLETLMSLDPKNPDPGKVPEVLEIQKVKYAAESVLSSGSGSGSGSSEADQEPPGIDSADVGLTVAAMNEVSKLHLKHALLPDLESVDEFTAALQKKEKPAPIHDNEPDDLRLRAPSPLGPAA